MKDAPLNFFDGDRSSKYPKRSEFQTEGIMFLNASSTSSGIFDITAVNYISPEKYETITKGRIKPNDIILTTRGNGVGDSFLFKENYGEALINAQMLIIRCDDEKLYSQFLYYYFINPACKDNFVNCASGSAQPQLPIKSLKEIEIKYPPLPTQRKIASILSAYDDLIENNLKRIKLLEEKAAIFYKNEFGDYQVSNKEFIELPKGWSIKTIGEIYGKLESGTRPKGGIDKELKEGVASVGAENVIGLGKYNYQSEKLITQEFFENMNRGKIEDRDVLVYKDGAYIGKTTLFQDEFPRLNCCVNEHVFLLTTKDVRYQYFLFFTLNQSLYFEKMQQLNANAAQPGINQESLKSLKLIWPSEDKVNEFNKEVETIIKLIFVLAKQNTKLREARDILLPRLMNGQIEVS